MKDCEGIEKIWFQTTQKEHQTFYLHEDQKKESTGKRYSKGEQGGNLIHQSYV